MYPEEELWNNSWCSLAVVWTELPCSKLSLSAEFLYTEKQFITSRSRRHVASAREFTHSEPATTGFPLRRLISWYESLNVPLLFSSYANLPFLFLSLVRPFSPIPFLSSYFLIISPPFAFIWCSVPFPLFLSLNSPSSLLFLLSLSFLLLLFSFSRRPILLLPLLPPFFISSLPLLSHCFVPFLNPFFLPSISISLPSSTSWSRLFHFSSSSFFLLLLISLSLSPFSLVRPFSPIPFSSFFLLFLFLSPFLFLSLFSFSPILLLPLLFLHHPFPNLSSNFPFFPLYLPLSSISLPTSFVPSLFLFLCPSLLPSPFLTSSSLLFSFSFFLQLHPPSQFFCLLNTLSILLTPFPDLLSLSLHCLQLVNPTSPPAIPFLSHSSYVLLPSPSCCTPPDITLLHLSLFIHSQSFPFFPVPPAPISPPRPTPPAHLHAPPPYPTPSCPPWPPPFPGLAPPWPPPSLLAPSLPCLPLLPPDSPSPSCPPSPLHDPSPPPPLSSPPSRPPSPPPTPLPRSSLPPFHPSLSPPSLALPSSPLTLPPSPPLPFLPSPPPSLSPPPP
ncbi:hypothetical protein C7M84_021822 [Penaeus vannamei]|uniref:Uncharacterized protein n=1 Tax=Penaeus vannamei TaxID=6689 RepID=A0A3R7Q9A1_PENVA|nr:hypothetical protein C7M84_021822 [Penaeus vannamei]